jgi:hypothetical protein
VNDISRYPSLGQHSGYYNVEMDWEGEGPAPRNWCTVEHPPDFDWDEFEAVRAATNSCLSDVGRSCSVPDKRLHDGGAWAVVDEVEDRTLTLDVDDLRLLCGPVVKALQREVLRGRELWRILIHGESQESCVLIYPSVIRVGERDPSYPLEVALDEAVRAIGAIREARDGSLWRQVAYLRAVMPAMMKRERKDPVSVVALFDRGFQGDSEKIAFWFLHRGKNSLAYKVLEGLTGSCLVVQPDGSCEDRLFEKNRLAIDEMWLVAWQVPVGTEHVVIEGDTSAGMTCRRYSFRIDPAAIIKDADLKRAQSEGRRLDQGQKADAPPIG